MAKCSQCGNNAMYEVEGHLLCLQCAKVWQDMLRGQIEDQVRALNFLHEEMEMITGMPGVLPRYELPKPPTINTRRITLNNIQVSDSVVGVINTGQIEKLDVAVDAVRDAGQEQLADALQKLSQAVVDAPDLLPQQKDEAVEHLAFLAEQASMPKERRQRSVAKTVIVGLEHVLNAAASVVTLWQAVRPYLLGLF